MEFNRTYFYELTICWSNRIGVNSKFFYEKTAERKNEGEQYSWNRVQYVLRGQLKGKSF